VLCLNGSALALESILQRLSGTNKLLWLVQPAINQSGESQFGPYAYRSNSAQYFNLLWPVCLGFWWKLRRASKMTRSAGARLGGGPHVVLLPCAVLLAAAPIISTSRGGALVAFGGILAAAVLLLFANRRSNWLMRIGMIPMLAATLGLAAYLGGDNLGKRLSTIFSDDLSGRVEIYENARQMARDFPLFGAGPGTFAWVYHLYRSNAQAEWAAYAHNDWLETRITFGWAGFAPILAMLVIVFLRWFRAGGIPAHWLFVTMIWLALAGCLLHARFDFPFQICSTLALFLLLCAVLFCLSRKT
jgi:O-antigen ligase